MSIKNKYKVISIKPSLCKEWLLYKHYAHRIPQIMYSFGLYDSDLLQGVITYGLPPSPELCYSCGEKFKQNFLELNRLCVNDGLEKNVTSYLVSQSLNLLPKPNCIVSYADTAQNHAGYIYQATNWTYTGLSKEQYDLKVKGSNRHSRHVYDNKNIETERVKRSQKHRYFYFLGDKRQVREMKSNLKYPVLPYPKGENKRYDAGYQPLQQETLFL